MTLARSRLLRTSSLAAPLLLVACVSIPNGPSVATFPGTGRSFDQFRVDESDCRRYSTDSIGGGTAARAQTDSAVTSAAVGTAVGALAGAAIGGGNGAGVGAGVGLLFGSAAGANAANASGYTMQQRYDNAYVQCMYAKGHKVPASGRFQVAAPRYAAPPAAVQAAPPAYNYPPPPPPPRYDQPPPPPPPPR